MTTTKSRLYKLEKQILMSQPAMTPEQTDARVDELLSKLGTSRDEVVARYGSLDKFAGELRRGLISRATISLNA